MSKFGSLTRPRSYAGGEIDDLEEEKKAKRKWGIKLFSRQDSDKSRKNATVSEQSTQRPKALFRNNSAEVAQLHEKISELELQLESYKQARYSPLNGKGTVQKHQKRLLEPSNWKDFRFKGCIVVKNVHNEEIETIEVVPDIVEFVNNGSESWLKQAIYNVDLTINWTNKSDVFAPRSISFFYYIREKGNMRYDYLFNINMHRRAIEAEIEEYRQNPTKSTDASFEITDICNGHEIKTKIQLLNQGEDKLIPVIKEFVIQISMSQNRQIYADVVDPIFTTKTIQNYWFHLEVVRKGEESATLGPFSPSEQHLDMEDSHYFIFQDIPLEGFSILGVPKNNEKKIEKVGSHDHIYIFNYYVRDKALEDSAMFSLASIEVSMAEIVKCSEGHQKRLDRFRLEKQLGLGMIRATFHFFVCEEMIPEPSTSGQALNPLYGYWLLERISFAIRM